MMIYSPIPRETVKKSLRVTVWDGIFVSVMLGIVDSYLIPFALVFKSSPAQISWLASWPALIGALAQCGIGWIVHSLRGRKNVLTSVVLVQAIALVGMAALPFGPEGARFPILVGLAVLYTTMGGMTVPVWNSLLTEYLPATKRAGYIGWRNRWTGLIVIGANLSAGVVLLLSGKGSTTGFTLIFLFAALCRFVSWRWLTRLFEPRLSKETLTPDTFDRFHDVVRGTPFWRLILFVGGITFATNLSGPYFSVYMLDHLRFSYLTYSILTMAVNFSMVNMMAVWGRKANTVGSMRILRWSTAVMPVLPVLWLFSNSPFYIFGIQLFGGIVWAGFNLCSLNSVFDIVPGRWRTQAVAYYNVANGIALFAGAFLGGQMMESLPSIHATPFLTLLLISGLLRGAIHLLMFPHAGTSGESDWMRSPSEAVSRFFFVPARMTCQALGLVNRK